LLFLVATVCFNGLGAVATDADDSPNSFGQTEEEARTSDESIDDERLYQFLRQLIDREALSLDNRVTNEELRPNLKDRFVPRDEDTTNLEDSIKTAADIRLEMLNEKPINLPKRFIYVASDFDRAWDKSEHREEDERETVEDEECHEKTEEDVWREDQAADNIETNGRIWHGLGWKNIIVAPVRECPPGQRKDKNGRCRTILW